MKAPIKKEMILDLRSERIAYIINHELAENPEYLSVNIVRVISADWAFNEINKLKEENERYKAALKEIKKNSVIAYPDRLRKYINEVLKDE